MGVVLGEKEDIFVEDISLTNELGAPKGSVSVAIFLWWACAKFMKIGCNEKNGAAFLAYTIMYTHRKLPIKHREVRPTYS